MSLSAKRVAATERSMISGYLRAWAKNMRQPAGDERPSSFSLAGLATLKEVDLPSAAAALEAAAEAVAEGRHWR